MPINSFKLFAQCLSHNASGHLLLFSFFLSHFLFALFVNGFFSQITNDNMSNKRFPINEFCGNKSRQKDSIHLLDVYDFTKWQSISYLKYWLFLECFLMIATHAASTLEICDYIDIKCSYVHTLWILWHLTSDFPILLLVFRSKINHYFFPILFFCWINRIIRLWRDRLLSI